MLHPQLLVYESDGVLARLLRPLAEAAKHRWSLREPRRAEACLALLERGSPSVVVLRVGGEVEAALDLLEQLHWLHPEAGRVVVTAADNPPLAGLAWDLGADYVLTLPQVRDQLPAVVTGLMEAAIGQHRLTAGGTAG